MPDASWDNTGEPAPKKGLPLWGKISLGCCGGCALGFVLLMATCVGGARWVAHHGAPEFLDQMLGSAFLDKAWARMDEVVRALKTDEGARNLYRRNPGLADNFPTEEDFLKAAQEWRPNLGEFPAHRPTLKELMADHHGDGSFRIHTQNHVTRIDYRIPKGGRLYLELDSDKLVDLRVE